MSSRQFGRRLLHLRTYRSSEGNQSQGTAPERHRRRLLGQRTLRLGIILTLCVMPGAITRIALAAVPLFPGRVFRVGGIAGALVISDLNGDGNLDVAVANSD